MIRREVIDKVGLLDEQFGLGCFEDDDYCLRARRAGFRAVIARDVFVHHYGGRTFVGDGVDFAALMRKNAALFRAKWSELAPNPVPAPQTNGEPSRRPTYGVRALPGGGLLLQRKPLLLSACIIARDSARTIKACLTSILPWVDAVIVVDTGSSDDTPRIAESLGARVFRFPWCDDFSAARNESLRHACGRWVIWIDTDDTIDRANGRKLRALAAADHEPAVLGYVLQVHCPGAGPDAEADVTVVDHVKLIRNLPALRFEGRIHEQLCGAIRRAGGELAMTDIFVVHSGYDHSAEGQRKKLERDLRILHKELAERPDHPFTLFNLGMTYADKGDYAEAADYLTRSIEAADPAESHLRKAYALLVYCQGQLKRRDAAWDACQRGLRLFPKDAELRFREGVLLHEAGRLAEALQAYRTLLATEEEPHFGSVVHGIKGFKARHNLALVHEDMGDWGAAEEQWRLVVAEAPRYRPGWRGLGAVLLRQGKVGEARTLAERLSADRDLRCEGLVLQAHAAIAAGDSGTAAAALECAAKEFPADAVAAQALARFQFEHGEPSAAAAALQDLVRRDPGDAAAYHNLGTVYLRLGRHADAVEAYRQSLRLRPNAPATRDSLRDAVQASGAAPGQLPANT
jgi:Flp pilus assembly protein TadD